MEDIFDEIRQEMKELYLTNDDKAFCLMFSGGKDSTLCLTLLWQMLEGLSSEERKKVVHVVCSNTRVETPVMEGYVRSTILRINELAQFKDLPIVAHLVEPPMKNRFFFKVMANRSTPPSPKQRGYRWCSDHLKRVPTQSKIKELLRESVGEKERVLDDQDQYDVLCFLGVRVEESARRRSSIQSYSIDDTKFARHIDYENILCYHPIKYVTNDELLFYLMELGDLPHGISFDEITIR